MSRTRTHTLDASQVHYAWDNALPPRLEIEPGDEVVFQTRDAADGYYTPQSTAEDVRRRVFPGHPLTGPVWVKGARPGHVLEVEIRAVEPGAWGWTAIMPGRGLLPHDFSEPYLHKWDLSRRDVALLRPDIAIPIEPFCGILGVALATPGPHSTMPPRENGGNMDVKQLTAGTTLYLPVQVEGALFSCGDAHAAQGDGEVCLTAIETTATVTLRFRLHDTFTIREPQFRTAGPLGGRPNTGPYYATTAFHTDLLEAARNAVRYMIDHLVRTRGLSREEAFVLCSVAVDLRISEVVDAPHWIVTAFLPESIFRG
ncbi:MAG: acetamidase/formamidase family protein [Chloroflexi bacterium]|nr:acetamidase/formamidase family protein [Chloroflexota bacterium]